MGERNRWEMIGHAQMSFSERTTGSSNRSSARRTLRDFRQACEDGETELHLQPIVSATGAVVGHECLIRWFPSDAPPLQPLQWIPGAERNGWITEVDRWVLQQAGEHLRHTAGHDTFVSVNVCADHFTLESLPGIVASALDGVLDPTRLVIEITESTPILDLETTVHTMDQLRSLGARMAVDDFGAGNTSIRGLRVLPLDIVKIDRTFTQNLDDPLDRNLLGLVVQAARHLDLTVVLEGVETERDWAFARALDIDLFQGYLFGRPAPWVDQECTPWIEAEAIELTTA